MEKNTQQQQQEADTQAQTQNWAMELDLPESQPIDVIWGRLYGKRVKIKSLGMRRTRPKFVLENSSRIIDLTKDVFEVGRNATGVTLSLEDVPPTLLNRISKRHFLLRKDLSDPLSPVYIKDLSINGTFRNGNLIGQNNEQIMLNDDSIAIFCTNFKAFEFKDLSPNQSHGLPETIKSNYHIGKTLGKGACGIVKLVYNSQTCIPFAMKQVDKNRLSQETIKKKPLANDEERIMNEVNIMKQLNHPCVTKLHDIVDDVNSVFMFLDLMNGGDLLNRIIKHENKFLPEKQAKLIFLQICLAIKYLHENNITHRDLKPENILLESNDEETLVKVSDFGLSKFVANDSIMKTLCGTPLYVAPEVLLTGGRGSYTKKVDIWSAGVVLFTCLSGTVPFSDEFGSAATEQIVKAQFSFRGKVWKSVSSVARELIMKMLTKSPNERPTIEDVLKHRWLQDNEIIEKAEKIIGIKLQDDVDQENDSENEENLDARQAAKRRRIDFKTPVETKIRRTIKKKIS